MHQPFVFRRLARPSALLLVGALAGTLALNPALAALPTSFKKLVNKLEKKLDPRYVNESDVGAELDSRYVNEDQVFTRHDSCPGLNFYPASSDRPYASNGILQFQSDGTPIPFRCALHLPDGATVTSARFLVWDADPNVGENITNCLLQRVRVADPTSHDAYDHMAGPMGTTDATTSGSVALTDSTIDFSVVDNATFAYEAECTLFPFPAPVIGIYGVSVTYTITGAGG